MLEIKLGLQLNIFCLVKDVCIPLMLKVWKINEYPYR